MWKVCLCVLASISAAVFATAEKPMVVLITSYNNAKWCERNVESVFMQKYSNYRVIYIDDCSADDTADRVAAIVNKYAQGNRFQLIRNPSRCGALANIYRGVHSCKDDEIIVSLDGDDWFASSNVLTMLNYVYTRRQVWLTHGSFTEYPSNGRGWSIPIPSEIVTRNAFREYRCPSHLRTFYARLFKKIQKEDLMYKGNFFSMTWDQAVMFPMLEMAGDRHAFMPQILYVYNVANPINDNKVDPQLQRDLEAYIRNMPRYSKLDSLDFNSTLQNF